MRDLPQPHKIQTLIDGKWRQSMFVVVQRSVREG
jgi:hypothetical protein